MLMTMDASLRAALARAIEVDNSRVELPTEAIPDADSQPPSRDALVSQAIETLERGGGPGALIAMVDLEAEALLTGVLTGRADDVASVTSELVRLGAAVERATERADTEVDLVALAEARGAFGALMWTARLAAEQLVGAALIVDGSHAANMLAAIAELPGTTNTDLEHVLGTDKTQVSRTGRQLLDAGLATVSKVGTRNSWRATAKGLAALQVGDRSERHARPPVPRAGTAHEGAYAAALVTAKAAEALNTTLEKQTLRLIELSEETSEKIGRLEKRVGRIQPAGRGRPAAARSARRTRRTGQ